MSLTTELSPLFQDISDVTTQPKNPYSSTLDCELRLHTVDKDLDYLDGVAVTELRIFRDYVNNIADYMELKVVCLLGTYIYDVYPYMDNLEVSLYLTRQERPNNKPIRIKERFKAVYLLEKNQDIPTTSNMNKDDLNQNLPIVFTLQLLDRSAEALRIKTVQGSFDKRINPKNKEMEPDKFVKSIISEHTGKVLVENKPSIDVVNIEPCDNKEQLKALTIRSATRLVELPEYIQTKSSGIYNSGVGNYIQRFSPSPSESVKGYFVYSLYSAKKYHTSEHKIIFYVPPTSTHSINDVTYKYADKTLRVVAHHNPAIKDTKESLIMSTGSGFRAANANSYSKKPVIMTEEGPEFSKTGLNTEIIYKDRADSINFAPGRGVSNNHFVLSSEILRKAGKYIPLRVTNLDPDFFYPAAACKVVYAGKDTAVEENYGVIHRSIIILAQQALNLQHSFTSPLVSLNTQIDFEIFVTE